MTTQKGDEKIKIRITLNRATNSDIQDWLEEIHPRVLKGRICETIDIVIRNNNNDRLKTLVFKNGCRDKKKTIYSIKEGKCSSVSSLYNNQLSLKTINYYEQKISECKDINAENANKIVIKTKLTFPIAYSIKFHVILIKKIDKKIKSQVNNLRFIVKTMFPKHLNCSTFARSSVWNVCDDVILEMTFEKGIFDDFFQKSPVLDELEDRFCIKNEKVSYEYIMGEISKHISPHLVDRYLSNQFGLKKMGYSARPVDMVDIYDNILKNTKKYFVSPKVDGQRCIIYYKDSKLYLVTDKLMSINIKDNKELYMIYITDFPDIMNILEYGCIIADSEIVMKDSSSNECNEARASVYVFDVMYCPAAAFNPDYKNHMQLSKNYVFPDDLKFSNPSIKGMDRRFPPISSSNSKLQSLKENQNSNYENQNSNYENQNLVNKSYLARVEYISYVVKILNAIVDDPSLVFKEKSIIDLSDVEDIRLYNSINDIDSPTDGLIITEKEGVSYHETLAFKWKPKKYSTIDFLIKSDPNEHSYTLMVGCQVKDKYIPVKFSPRDYPLAYKFTQKNNRNSFISNNIDGKIGEFYWTGKKWKLLRLREDRTADLARGNYFGNNIRTAELTWQARKNYVDMTDIYNPTSHPCIKFVPIHDIFVRYIKKKFNGVIIFGHNITFEHDVIKTFVRQSIRNSGVFMFTEGYTETWMIKKIYSVLKNTALMKKLYICPPMKDIIKESLKGIRQSIEDKGIPIQNADIILVICDDLNINQKLSKIIGILKYFLNKNGKIIFVNPQFEERHMNIFSSKKMELELYTDKIVSFVKF